MGVGASEAGGDSRLGAPRASEGLGSVSEASRKCLGDAFRVAREVRRVVELRRLRLPVSVARRAGAAEGAHRPLLAHRADAVVAGVGDEEGAVWAERDPSRAREGRRSARSVGVSRLPPASDRPHLSRRAHPPHRVRRRVDDEGVARRGDDDATRVEELGVAAQPIARPWPARPCERPDLRKGTGHDCDAVIAAAAHPGAILVAGRGRRRRRSRLRDERHQPPQPTVVRVAHEQVARRRESDAHRPAELRGGGVAVVEARARARVPRHQRDRADDRRGGLLRLARPLPAAIPLAPTASRRRRRLLLRRKRRRRGRRSGRGRGRLGNLLADLLLLLDVLGGLAAAAAHCE
mmetsp:Transcript_50353/g.164540  ORF Transcript_50353/g.164540 Transcript_50353/m.164540 type:complete len:349 (-) Transcript_50353:35-1081(-)